MYTSVSAERGLSRSCGLSQCFLQSSDGREGLLECSTRTKTEGGQTARGAGPQAVYGGETFWRWPLKPSRAAGVDGRAGHWATGIRLPWWHLGSVFEHNTIAW
ncbi:hypothetical protein J6590_010270 [Homalodisca vitripennis]|nr:hypothetical protein J6590_010270 [Homalodisca vitripennis]